MTFEWFSAIWPTILTISVLFVMRKWSLVYLSLTVLPNSKPMSHSLIKFTFVCLSINKFLITLAMVLIVFPHSFINVAIWINFFSKSIFAAFTPLSKIFITLYSFDQTFTMFLAIPEPAMILILFRLKLETFSILLKNFIIFSNVEIAIHKPQNRASVIKFYLVSIHVIKDFCYFSIISSIEILVQPCCNLFNFFLPNFLRKLLDLEFWNLKIRFGFFLFGRCLSQLDFFVDEGNKLCLFHFFFFYFFIF